MCCVPFYWIAHVVVSPSRSLKLFGREINFEEFQPRLYDHAIITVPKRHSRTDRRTIGLYCGITALSVQHRALKVDKQPVLRTSVDRECSCRH